jgi:hypothetical protein
METAASSTANGGELAWCAGPGPSAAPGRPYEARHGHAQDRGAVRRGNGNGSAYRRGIAGLQSESVHLFRHMEPVFGRLFELPPYLGIDLGGAFKALACMGAVLVRLHPAAGLEVPCP